MPNNRGASIALLVAIIGALLQVTFWFEPQGSGLRGVGFIIFVVAMGVAARLMPQRVPVPAQSVADQRVRFIFRTLLLLLVLTVVAILMVRVIGPTFSGYFQAINQANGDPTSPDA